MGHTQRVSIDIDRNEIYVMTGLHKDREKGGSSVTGGSSVVATSGAGGDRGRGAGEDAVSNAFWAYSIGSNRWTCLYRSDDHASFIRTMTSGSDATVASSSIAEPRPRYAHQLVYDDINKVHFIFGGNPGGKEGRDAKVRLGDFWKMKLKRPTRQEVGDY